jgi:hypothetical protein
MQKGIEQHFPLKRLRANVLDYQDLRRLSRELSKEKVNVIRSEAAEVILEALETVRAHFAEEIHASTTGTGNLAESLTYHFNWQYASGYLYFDEEKAPYAQFVEYGTGVVGQSEPGYPLPAGWVHDSNEHGEDGWVYLDAKNKLKHTKGQPGRSYIYYASVMLEGLLPDTVNYKVVRGRH